MMEYTAIIRTLGTAGEKYLTLLKSLECQTIKPQKIIVYIANGYSLPKETIGKEQYVYVDKGMMAQRALRYDEVGTDYMLLLDDDLFLPNDTVERMFSLMIENNADVISPDIFPNATRPLVNELMMTLSARMRARYIADDWGYKVMLNSGYSYAKYPTTEVLWSQTNAGACFLCRKHDLLQLKLEDELWLDAVPYALGDDQVIYYKMHLNGLKILTWYTHEVVHLDGGQNYTKDKEKALIYSDFRFKVIFWYRFIYTQNKNIIMRLISILCMLYTLMFAYMISFVKCELDILKVKHKAVVDAIKCIKSKKFRELRSVI